MNVKIHFFFHLNSEESKLSFFIKQVYDFENINRFEANILRVVIHY